MFVWSKEEGGGGGVPQVYGNGCVGVSMQGDVWVDTMIAQGTKPGES